MAGLLATASKRTRNPPNALPRRATESPASRFDNGRALESKRVGLDAPVVSVGGARFAAADSRAPNRRAHRDRTKAADVAIRAADQRAASAAMIAARSNRWMRINNEWTHHVGQMLTLTVGLAFSHGPFSSPTSSRAEYEPDVGTADHRAPIRAAVAAHGVEDASCVHGYDGCVARVPSFHSGRDVVDRQAHH